MGGMTIKELADEIGVSKQAIQQKIKILNINTDYREGNRIVLTDNQVFVIKAAFQKNIDNQINNQIADSDRLIDLLQRELEIKNEQISSLSRVIEKQQKLLDQQQQLQAMQQQKQMEQLEEKKVPGEKEPEDKSYLSVKSNAERESKMDAVEEIANDKGFWKRLRQICNNKKSLDNS